MYKVMNVETGKVVRVYASTRLYEAARFTSELIRQGYGLHAVLTYRPKAGSGPVAIVG